MCRLEWDARGRWLEVDGRVCTEVVVRGHGRGESIICAIEQRSTISTNCVCSVTSLNGGMLKVFTAVLLLL